MHKIFVLLTMIAQMCFASPFDLADEYDDEIEQTTEDTQISSATNSVQTIIAEDIQQPETNIIQPLIKVNQAKFITIDIKNGRKTEFILTTGESIKIDDINFRLQNCHLEKDDFYRKISIAEVFIDGKTFTISNDTNLSSIRVKNMILIIDCNYK